MQKPRSFPERGLLFVMSNNSKYSTNFRTRMQCYALLYTGKRKNEKENQQKKEQKRKAHYMSLHQKVKTADLYRKNF